MNEWSAILSTYDEIEAHIVKDVLESESIKVVIESLKISPYPVNIGRIGEVRVLVKDKDVDRALKLLDEFELQNNRELNDN